MRARNAFDHAALVALTLLFSAKLVLLVSIAFRARFVMDELAMLQFVFAHSASEFYRAVDPIKTVLAYAAYAPAFLGSDSIATALAARASSLVAVFASCSLILGITRRLTRSPLAPALSLALLASFSNFMEQAFRVRTDTIALPFALGALWVLVRFPFTASGNAFAVFGAGTLLGASFLCTQKAVYFAFAVGFGLVVSIWSEDGAGRAAIEGAKLAGGWTAITGIYCAIFGRGNAVEVFQAVLDGPRYIVAGSVEFQGLGGYVAQTLVRNPLSWALALVGLLGVLLDWRRRSASVRLLSTSSFVLVGFVFAHDQPWPYVFVWAQALISASFAPFADRFFERIRTGPAAPAVVAVLLLAVSLPRNVRYLAHDNREIFPAIREAEANLAPGERYFDGIGMIVRRRIAGDYPDWWWDTPTLARLRRSVQANDLRMTEAILRDQPKLWILNYRLRAAAPVVAPLISGAYVRVSPTLAVAGAELPAGGGEVRLTTRWSGDFQLYDESGRPTGETFSVDRQEPLAVQRLDLGTHEVSSVGKLRFLLPVGLKLTNARLPYAGPVPDLFAGVYDY